MSATDNQAISQWGRTVSRFKLSEEASRLLVAEIDGEWFGIGNREELDALKAEGAMPTEATYRPVTLADAA